MESMLCLTYTQVMPSIPKLEKTSYQGWERNGYPEGNPGILPWRVNGYFKIETAGSLQQSLHFFQNKRTLNFQRVEQQLHFLGCLFVCLFVAGDGHVSNELIKEKWTEVIHATSRLCPSRVGDIILFSFYSFFFFLPAGILLWSRDSLDHREEITSQEDRTTEGAYNPWMISYSLHSPT